MVLTGILSIVYYGSIFTGNTSGTVSLSPHLLVPLVAFLLFSSLYYLNKIGKDLLAANLLILILSGFCLNSLADYGILSPQPLLALSLAILIAGAISTTLFTTILTGIICSVIVALYYLQSHQVIQIARVWSNKDILAGDAISFSITFIVILMLTLLFHRETNRALQSALESESALREERDNLEKHVEERTQDLRASQYEQVLQLNQMADLGRQISSLFHDLANPLTAINLNLEELQILAEEHRQDRALHRSVTRALQVTERMEQFIETTRRQIRQEKTVATFPLDDEIRHALRSVQYRARLQQVRLHYHKEIGLSIHADRIKTFKLVQNMVSNAIDSYASLPKERDRSVTVQAKLTPEHITISIQDHGCGIAPENIPRIFDPFYTTKGFDQGTGIGLSICREIVERDLDGTLDVTSEPGKGTTFTALLPRSLERKPEA